MDHVPLWQFLSMVHLKLAFVFRQELLEVFLSPCCSSQQRIIPVFTATRPENHEHPGLTFSLDPCAQRFLLILWNFWGFPPLQVILLLLLSVAFSAVNLFFYLLQLRSLQHQLSDKPQRAMILTKQSFIKDCWYSRDISFTGSLLASTDRVTDNLMTEP